MYTLIQTVGEDFSTDVNPSTSSAVAERVVMEGGVGRFVNKSIWLNFVLDVADSEVDRG